MKPVNATKVISVTKVVKATALGKEK